MSKTSLHDDCVQRILDQLEDAALALLAQYEREQQPTRTWNEHRAREMVRAWMRERSGRVQ